MEEFPLEMIHLVAGMVMEANGEATFKFENLLSTDAVGKNIQVVIEDGIVHITLVEPEKEN